MRKLRVNLFFTIIIFVLNLYSNSVANVSLILLMISLIEPVIFYQVRYERVKIQKLIKIGENSVDIDGIGFYTLGKHRKILNDNQKTG